MTQEEIIEMARQAGFGLRYEGRGQILSAPTTTEKLEAFAKLVAEKVNADWSETNERLIKVFNEKADLAYLSGAKEEREACAKLFELTDLGGLKSDVWLQNYTATMLDGYAKAIRARGQA